MLHYQFDYDMINNTITRGGVLMAQDLKRKGFNVDYKGSLIFYEGSDENVVVPECIKEIGAGAFNGNSVIKRVALPDGLQRIGECAFKECTNLEEINIPATVTYLGGEAFCNCYSLKRISLPGSIGKVADKMFFNCESLTEVEFGYGIVEIGRKVFDRNWARHTTSLKKVILPETLETIEAHAFMHCGALKYINFPASLKDIGHSAFYGSALENVEIPKSSIYMWGFYGSSEITKIKIGEGATYIAEEAFRASSCKKVRRIYLPSTMLYVKKNAFYSEGHNIIYSPINAAILAYCQVAGHSVSWEIDFENPKTMEELLSFYLEQKGITEEVCSKAESIKTEINQCNEKICEYTRDIITMNGQVHRVSGVFAGVKRLKIEKEQSNKKQAVESLQNKVAELTKQINHHNKRIADLTEELKNFSGEQLKRLIDARIESIKSSISYHVSDIIGRDEPYTPCNYTLSLDSVNSFRSSMDYILVPRIDVSDI